MTETVESNAHEISVLKEAKTLKERGIDFIFQQGVPTILLMVIAAGAWTGLPGLIDRVEGRMEYINDSHERRLTAVIADQAEDRKLYREDREMFRAEQQRLQLINERLMDELRGRP